jgi:hypothetical protein
MTDNAELHGKILGFLMAEWARKDQRQLVGVDLLYAPGQGYRDEEIRRWERADEPEFFAEFVNVEKLVSLIIEIAEGEADAKPSGKHRFVVRTRQHMGSKPTMSFALQPSHHGSADEVSIIPSHGAGGGGGAGGGRGTDVALAQILSGNNSQLMRINAQMFDAALRPLAQQNSQLLAELIALREENSQLQKKLAEAEANKSDREFQIAMAMEKNARANAGFQKLLQIGTVVASKIASGGEGQGPAQLGEANPLGMLLGEFYSSLRQEQLGVLMQTLDMGQKIMFMEIVNLVKPPNQGPPQQPGPPNGSR